MSPATEALLILAQWEREAVERIAKRMKIEEE